MRIYNVRIDAVTPEEAVERLMGGEAHGRTVFTPNAVMLDACRRDGSLAKMLNRSSLSVADGSGVLLAARRQGEPLPCRVAGIELGERMMREAAERGSRVFLLGGREGVAEAARDRLCGEIENLSICGTYHGYFDKTGEENERVCELIRASTPDILFVCFGFPVQEEWILRNIKKLPSVRVAAALGGSLDVWSGKVRRAPRAARAMHLEWAWRMLCEPKRMKNLPALIRVAFLRK